MKNVIACGSTLLLVLATACAPPDSATDALESNVTEATSPVADALARLRADSLRGDGRIDVGEMRALLAFVRVGSARGRNEEAERFVRKTLASDADRIDTAAKDLADAVLEGKDGRPGLATSAYRLVEKGAGSFVFDDDLYLLADGAVAGRPALRGHSRGYASYRDGVLRFAHGSSAPSSSVSTASEHAEGRSQKPSRALDRAAQLYGLSLGDTSFTYFAEKAHYRPGANTPYWEGLCHAWTNAALDDRLSVLVDVEGPRGRRGVWYAGQWLSRADLGNWLMGTYDALSVIDATTVDSFVRPENWIKGIIRHAMNGTGLRADLWNDTDKGRSEVWNQPIVSARLDVATVDSDTASRVVAFARGDKSRWEPVPTAGASVKLVTVDADWAVETSDAHEEGVAIKQSRWSIYAIVDAEGKVARGYMAHLLPASVGALPVRTSDSLPDYFAFPTHRLVDDVLAGTKNEVVEGAFQGKVFEFFVGEVLARGVPAATRDAFEREALAPEPASVDVLRERFPGVANAYSREQWDRAFAARLGDGSAFGAFWMRKR